VWTDANDKLTPEQIRESLDKAEERMLLYLEDHPEFLSMRIAMGYANRPFVPNKERRSETRCK